MREMRSRVSHKTEIFPRQGWEGIEVEGVLPGRSLSGATGGGQGNGWQLTVERDGLPAPWEDAWEERG